MLGQAFLTFFADSTILGLVRYWTWTANFWIRRFFVISAVTERAEAFVSVWSPVLHVVHVVSQTPAITIKNKWSEILTHLYTDSCKQNSDPADADSFFGTTRPPENFGTVPTDTEKTDFFLGTGQR